MTEGSVMAGRAAMVVVAAVMLAWRTTSGYTPPFQDSPFCKMDPGGFVCNYFNTTQDMVLGSSGTAAVDVASQHPAISCLAPRLDVSNDSLIIDTRTGKPATSGGPRASQLSSDRTATDMGGTGTSSSSSKGVAGTEPSNASTASHQPLQNCAVNVSVQNSTVHRIRGYFVSAQFHESVITHLGGVYTKVEVKSSAVSNVSLSGKMVQLEDTKIDLVSQLRAEGYLEVRRSALGTVAPNGLRLLPARREEPERLHILSDVAVGRLEEGSLVFKAKVSVTNMTVDWLPRDAVTVLTPGVLTLTDVVLHCTWFDCLNLQPGARLVLKNVTVKNKTINQLDLLASSEADTYPLFALVSKEDSRPLTMTFPWYWLVVMTVCGLVAGVVIGSAFMWKRPSLHTISTVTLSDLLSQDRLQQDNSNEYTTRTDLNTGCTARPALTRQDSGLTSSSFASYTPFQTGMADVERGSSRPTSYINSVMD